MQSATSRKPWYRILYVQVLIAVFIGIVVGNQFPDLGKNLKPLGDGFVSLVKMIIAPVIFCTVIHTIASMTDLKKLGRVGIKALLYFEFWSERFFRDHANRREMRTDRRIWRDGPHCGKPGLRSAQESWVPDCSV